MAASQAVAPSQGTTFIQRYSDVLIALAISGLTPATYKVSLPVTVAYYDVVPPRAEYFVHATDFAGRFRRRGHHGIRQLRGRW